MIALMKVRWDSKRVPELTWELKDQIRSRESKRNGNVMVVNGQILGEFWALWINEFLKGICKRVMALGELREIISEVFVKLLLDSFGKLSISVSLLLTPLCCDDIHDVTPHVSALAGCGTTGVSTAVVTISTAKPRTPPSSITVFDDEDVTMAMA
ncbi:hypothetical protein Tco_1130916 [Tanacetum coccineum]